MDAHQIDRLERIHRYMIALPILLEDHVNDCEPRGVRATADLGRLLEIAQYLRDELIAVEEIMAGEGI
jgi:hypothetical protein